MFIFLFSISYDSDGCTYRYSIRRYVFCNNCSGTNHRTITYCHAGEYRHVIAYPHIVADMYAAFAVFTLLLDENTALLIIMVGGYDTDKLRNQAIGADANLSGTPYVIIFADIGMVAYA